MNIDILELSILLMIYHQISQTQ